MNEPLAWRYELATYYDRETGLYSDWEGRLSEYEPYVPEGSIRNLTPLYAAQRPWNSMADGGPPEQPGLYVDVRAVSVYRWLPYKPDGQRQMRAKGRWQVANEHGGFENASLPQSGDWKPNGQR